MAKLGKRAINVVSDLVGDFGHPLRCLSSDLVLVLLEPLFNVPKVGEEGTLVPRMYHPDDEK